MEVIDTGNMSSRANIWPKIYSRTYPSGRVKFVVDLGMQKNGTRARKSFDTQGEATAFAQQARTARQQHGADAFSLSFDDLAKAVKLHELLTENGFSFDDVYQHYAKDVIPYATVPKVAEIAEQLAKRGEAKGLRPSSCKVLRCFLNAFSRTFGDRKIGDINAGELENFCFRPDDMPATKRRRRALASQLFNFAVTKGWAPRNIAKDFDAPRVEDKDPVFLTVDDVHRLLSAADEFGLLGYVVLAVFLGIRPTEIMRLQWSDVHIDDGRVVIREAASKIHERREVPINPTAAGWLSLCRGQQGPIVASTNFRDQFRQLRAAAKIANWAPDVLRHSFATFHGAAFKNPEETKRQMGHIGGLRILRKHYMAYVPESVAKEFWALRPASCLRPTEKVAA